jgi:hypothetical protein
MVGTKDWSESSALAQIPQHSGCSSALEQYEFSALAAPGTITGSKAATEILPDVQMMAHRLSE